MRTSMLLALLFLACWTSRAATAPAPEKPPEKEKPKDTGPLEVDFSPLAGATGIEYQLRISFETEDQTSFKETYNIGAGTTVTSVRDLVNGSIGKGWKTLTVGDHKLVINGYMDSPITKFEIKPVKLPKEQLPTVRWLGNKAK